MKEIPFNRPFLTGNESRYLDQAVATGKISGNGLLTKKCQAKLVELFGCKKSLLTTSCTDALEMSAMLAEIKPGDEVIMPSFTFVSTANAFILRGAKIVFVDSRPDHPGMNEEEVQKLITGKTRAIVCVHYAGVACDMDKLLQVAKNHGLFLIEDAAQCIDAYYRGSDGKNRPLGAIGDLGTLSFHETKNIQCGEGGALLINNKDFLTRSEVIWEKGTNRAAFWRGEVDKYGWVDIGSSFLPSELSAAFLFSQLQEISSIQKRRKEIWELYDNGLRKLSNQGKFRSPDIPDYATNNAHMYYIICKDLDERMQLIDSLKRQGIHSVFHYLSLHNSPYFKSKHDGRCLVWSDHYSDCLVRLPLHMYLSNEDVNRVIEATNSFYMSRC